MSETKRPGPELVEMRLCSSKNCRQMVRPPTRVCDQCVNELLDLIEDEAREYISIDGDDDS